MKTIRHGRRPTPSRRSSGFILLLIVLGIAGIGATVLLDRLGVSIERTEQQIARRADHDYFQMQMEKVLDRRVAPVVLGRLAKTDAVDGRQLGLL